MSNPYTNIDNTNDISGSAAMADAPVTESTGFSWDWQNSYIETDHTHTPSLAAQPDSTLFLVGPPRKAGNVDKGSLNPVGYVQGIQASQNRVVQRLYDFGSARAFFTVGKTSGQLSLTRLFFKGANLLSTLYQNALGSAGGEGSSQDNSANTGVFNKKMYSYPGILNGDGENDSSGFFIDIGSELFLNPFGCAMVYRSKAGHAIGGVYYELCMFNTHSISMDPQQPQMMENINVEFDRAIAFDVTKSTPGSSGS